MQQFTWTVLDEYFVGHQDTIEVVTAGRLDDALGRVDQLLVELSVDNLHGRNMTATLRIEHSGDGIHWLRRNAKPEIDRQKLEWTAKNYLPFVFEDGLTPTLAYVRIRVTLVQHPPLEVHPVRARIVCVVTGNDYNEAAFRATVHEEELEALEDSVLEKGDKLCARKFGPGTVLPNRVGSMAEATIVDYIDYDAAKKVFRVRPPYTICENSDGLLAVLHGTQLVASTSWDSLTNSAEYSHG